MEPTRVNRLVKTLAHLGLTEQTESRKYAVGPGIHVLSAQTLYASGLLRKALPVIRRLQVTGCTVALGVLWHDHVAYLCHADPALPVEEGIGRMNLYPATLSSIGMVLLALQPESAVRRQYTNRTIPRYDCDIERLMRDLAVIRRRNYAFVNTPASTTVAVPVGGRAQSALALAGRRVGTDLAGCVDALRRAAIALDG